MSPRIGCVVEVGCEVTQTEDWSVAGVVASIESRTNTFYVNFP